MPDHPQGIADPHVSSGFTVLDEDPPGVTAMAFTAGSAALIGIILVLLGLLGDCLEALLILLGAALIGVALFGRAWTRKSVARYRRQLDNLRSKLEESAASRKIE